jgi:arginine/lysine/histidine/glutamine transport system substrate-binding and permease protein
MAIFTRSCFLRQLVLALIGMVCALTVAACNSDTNTGDGASSPSAASTSLAVVTLKVATEPSFPPFESQDSSNNLVGFDIELVRAIGEAAGFNVEFQSLPFDGIIPALQAGTIDAAVSAMTIKAERAQVVDFSRPYFKAGLAIAVQNSNTDITSFESLNDKRIAAQIGTTGAEKSNSVPGARVTTFDNAPLALQELLNGNVDAVINDAPVTLYAITSGSVKGIKVVGQLLTEEYYGIPTPKGSPNLEKINQGLTTILGNGKYNEIYQKWFGSTPPELPEKAPGL